MTATTYTLSLNVQIPSISPDFIIDDSSKRYLRRDWKRKYNPHIPQHSSLPVLRLVPTDRPLFVCEKCSSSNLFLPLCLWCQWTSSSAVKGFEDTAPRPRTTSAPKFSSDLIQRKQKDGKRRVGVVIGEGSSKPRDSLESALSTEPPATPKAICSLLEFAGVAGDESCSYEEIEMIVSTPVAEPQYICKQPNAEAWSDAESDTQSFVSDDNSRPNLLPEQATSTLLDRNHYAGRGRGSTLSEPAHPSQPRLSAARHAAHRSMSTSPCSSYRPPRSRPLYHYIRNANPHSPSPSSPFDSGVAQIPTRDQPQSKLRELPATRDYEFAIPTPHALNYSKKGFSVSGETEQRMHLARRKSDSGNEYVFHEAKSKKRDRLSNTMKDISRAFRAFFKVCS